MSKKKIVVVGSGVAGLTCALGLIEKGHTVILITKSQTSDSATWYAQGGVASAMFKDDSTTAHLQDTLNAGGHLCNVDAVRVLVENGSNALAKLISRGAHFDKLADGSYARTREGGHSNNRIIHAGGDATGEEIERSLVKATSNVGLDNLNIFDYRMVTGLLIDNDICVGVESVDANGTHFQIECDDVVLATGGAGQLFRVTTNPILSTGDGLAVALNAGVMCTDLEFMQFHPTALHVNDMPRPLISEALRGEGAVLRDDQGNAFMRTVHELGDLAPRDIVSREIARVMQEKNIENVYLDATQISNFTRRFPTIHACCERAGIDPSVDYLPVSPAAHYYCGGIATDLWGATSLKGLWAAGEVACNGLHGANRLASNSLLEGLVFGEQVAIAVDEDNKDLGCTGLFFQSSKLNEFNEKLSKSRKTRQANDNYCDSKIAVELRLLLQNYMNKGAGVLRHELGLKEAQVAIEALEDKSNNLRVEGNVDFSSIELSHLIELSKVMIKISILRKESRGCHSRDDYPDELDSGLGRFFTSYEGDQYEFVSISKSDSF